MWASGHLLSPVALSPSKNQLNCSLGEPRIRSGPSVEGKKAFASTGFRSPDRPVPVRVALSRLPVIQDVLHNIGTFAVIARINPLKPELNPICYLLALLGAHHFLHVSRIRVKLLTFRRLMSYIYEAPILDVSRSHTTTQHGR